MQGLGDAKLVLNLSLTPNIASSPGPGERQTKLSLGLNQSPAQGGVKAVEPPASPPSTVLLTALSLWDSIRPVAQTLHIRFVNRTTDRRLGFEMSGRMFS